MIYFRSNDTFNGEVKFQFFNFRHITHSRNIFPLVISRYAVNVSITVLSLENSYSLEGSKSSRFKETGQGQKL